MWRWRWRWRARVQRQESARGKRQLRSEKRAETRGAGARWEYWERRFVYLRFDSAARYRWLGGWSSSPACFSILVGARSPTSSSRARRVCRKRYAEYPVEVVEVCREIER